VPSLASWLTFLHVVVAFAFVAGLIGRNFTHRHAVRSSNLSTVSNLMDLAGRFEQWLIVPGSFVLLFGGLLTMWAEHLPFFEHGGYWLVTSLVVFVGLFAVLVPFVFIPPGTDLRSRYGGRSKARRRHSRTLGGASRQGRRRRARSRTPRGGLRPLDDGPEALLNDD
jgi:hypothetical protein